MVNKDFEPGEKPEKVLEALKKENRANPTRIKELTDLRKQRINEALRELVAAGWVERITRGLYEFKEDPRQRE